MQPQPDEKLRVFERGVLFLIIPVGDVHGQPAAVFALLRTADERQGAELAVLFRGAAVYVLLRGGVGIAAGEIDLQSLGAGIRDHLRKVVGDARVHRHPADAHGRRRLLRDRPSPREERKLPGSNVHVRLCLAQPAVSRTDLRRARLGQRFLLLVRRGVLDAAGIEHEQQRAERAHPGPKDTLERQNARPFPLMRQA